MKQKNNNVNETKNWFFDKIYKNDKPKTAYKKERERRHKFLVSGMRTPKYPSTGE